MGALNAGFEKARGEYFCGLSSDDTYYPDTFEVLLGAFSGLQTDHALVYGGYDLLVDETGDHFAIAAWRGAQQRCDKGRSAAGPAHGLAPREKVLITTIVAPQQGQLCQSSGPADTTGASVS